MRKIVYSFMVLDLPHWGHLIHIKMARELGDVLIVGILDDDTVESYKRRPIMKLEGRMKLGYSIKGIDMIIPQFEKYPIENLKLLRGMFPNDEIICVHGEDWKKEDFQEVEGYLKTINGKLVLLPHYPSLCSTTTLIKEIIDRHEKGELEVKD